MEDRKPFTGFAFTDESVSLPEEFFTVLLPHIAQADELKLILYCFWRMAHQSAEFPYLLWDEVLQDKWLTDSLLEQADQPQAALEKALQLAIRHNALLETESGSRRVLLLNTPAGRATLNAIQQGHWRPGQQSELPPDYFRERLNIYALYENHIGPLTPMMADTLKDAEEQYPANWIEEAIDIAVKANKRSWRYVAAILQRWQEGGRDERRDRADSQTDYRKYTDGEFSDYIER
jgi:DnaD/phage-associated family protein